MHRIASGIAVRGVMELLTDDEKNLFSYLAGITTSETLSNYNQMLVEALDGQARDLMSGLFPLHTSS